MKRFLAVLALFGVVGLSAAPAFADDKPAAPVAAAAEAAPAPAAAPVAAPAPAAEAAAAEIPAPKVDKGDTTWLMVCAALVILMSIPGLALFYGGLVRSKNMLSVLMQVFMVFSLITVLWCIYGYSVAFTEGSAFFGSLDKLFLSGVTPESLAATFSKGVAVPEFAYIVFQGAFAAITCGLIIGAFAERIKFSALLVFVVLWFSFSYLPMAHMVWYWAGPDGYVDAAAAEKLGATAGFLFQKGALDFAGGTVVHINAAVAGLVGAFLIGKRIGYGRESMAPHSLTMTMIGASLLWFGWFGFNAGSALEANGTSALAFINTWLATAAATVSWVFAEWLIKGKPSMLGAASGAVAGLVAITPAAGFVGVVGALVLGLLAGVVCLWGVNGLKRLLGADDSLDVFGVHGVGGILGAVLTGVFAAPSLGGTGIWDYVTNAVAPEYSIGDQVIIQLTGVGTTIIWSAVVSLVAYKLVDMFIGLRVPEEEEREGLDVTSHGESAYHL
ncbi:MULTISPECIES: ammonium transporter [Azospira]|jgi:Amt family ammonium transporter|uniref:Ammonium transporter n=1 Tax=Azospira oryzae TaxID=146939 RepID=A0ABY0IQ16_9RHOO|nr:MULTISPECIES: ammonium transporter [Azospira]RZT76488.1 ammonium transporter [Azospira oryzae]TLS19292.1 MAG: ammonium transporter [Betaproteobacteria bacterium]BBN89302.1 ammonium transporter [Azospira sp. I09]